MIYIYIIYYIIYFRSGLAASGLRSFRSLRPCLARADNSGLGAGLASLQADLSIQDGLLATFQADLCVQDELLATLQADLSVQNDLLATLQADLSVQGPHSDRNCVRNS